MTCQQSYAPSVARALVTALVLLNLSGCATYENFRESRLGAAQLLNPQRITPKNPRDTAQYESAWKEQDPTPATPNPPASPHTRPSEYSMFYSAEYKAQMASATADDLKKFYKQGIVLSDSVCNAWFDTLEETQANVEFTRNNYIIAAATATTIMGAVEAAAKEIAVVAAAFAGATSVIDNYESSFLFTPDMHIVRKKIDGLREAAVKKMFVDDVPPDYAESKRRLLKYHQICSGAEVRDLIQTAVINTSYEFNAEQWVSKIQSAASQVLSPDQNVGVALVGTMDASAALSSKLKPATDFKAPEFADLQSKATKLMATISDVWAKLGNVGTKPSQESRESLSKFSAQMDETLAASTLALKSAETSESLKGSVPDIQALESSLRTAKARLTALQRAYALAEAVQ